MKQKALRKLDDRIAIYGCKKHRSKNPPSEDAEQMTIFNELRVNYPDVAAVATHVKNEGKKTHAEVKKDYQMGLLAGFSDIVIAGNPTMFCELKKEDITKSKISEQQEDFLIRAQKRGSFAFVALGHKGFLEGLRAWVDAQR